MRDHLQSRIQVHNRRMMLLTIRITTRINNEKSTVRITFLKIPMRRGDTTMMRSSDARAGDVKVEVKNDLSGTLPLIGTHSVPTFCDASFACHQSGGPHQASQHHDV